MTKKLEHVAFIMDGNGRWAKQRNMQRFHGHKAGIQVIEPVVKEAMKLKIPYVSFYAFSTENWNRPPLEVRFLLRLLNWYLSKETMQTLIDLNIKFKWIGFEDNLPNWIVKRVKEIEKATENLNGITVSAFFNYGGMADIENATKIINQKQLKQFSIKEHLLTKDLPPIDLLIRTSGENRISNFALYDLAYSEIIFEKTLWPDYSKELFLDNINEYNSRNRRFGSLDDK